MKKLILGMALLTTLSTVSVAAPGGKGKKVKRKAKTEQCMDKESGHCCPQPKHPY